MDIDQVLSAFQVGEQITEKHINMLLAFKKGEEDKKKEILLALKKEEEEAKKKGFLLALKKEQDEKKQDMLLALKKEEDKKKEATISAMKLALMGVMTAVELVLSAFVSVFSRPGHPKLKVWFFALNVAVALGNLVFLLILAWPCKHLGKPRTMEMRIWAFIFIVLARMGNLLWMWFYRAKNKVFPIDVQAIPLIFEWLSYFCQFLKREKVPDIEQGIRPTQAEEEAKAETQEMTGEEKEAEEEAKAETQEMTGEEKEATAETLSQERVDVSEPSVGVNQVP